MKANIDILRPYGDKGKVSEEPTTVGNIQTILKITNKFLNVKFEDLYNAKTYTDDSNWCCHIMFTEGYCGFGVVTQDCRFPLEDQTVFSIFSTQDVGYQIELHQGDWKDLNFLLCCKS